MSKAYAVLPCNGLDKCAGCIAGEIAKKLSEVTESEILCPVLYRVADTRYNKIAGELPLVVIDGCATRCASKLATEKGLKVSKKINVTDEAKSSGIIIDSSLRLGDNEQRLVNIIIENLTKEEEKKVLSDVSIFPDTDSFEFETYLKDKFIFKLPKEGFYFNENDCWAYIIGNKARIGITDFMQKNLSDIMFFTPPAPDSDIEQFDEAGTLESGKAVFEIVSPVSGKITAVNEKLLESPELVNEDPYGKGWIAEIELSDFESDKDLLLEFDGYFKIMKEKVDEYHV